MQDYQKCKPFGPIRDVTRNYISDHFAIAGGTSVLGETITHTKKHTVYTLARQVDVSPATVQRAFIYAGFLEGEAERPSRRFVFDAETAEILFHRINMALSNRDLRNFLNCRRTQAEQLVGVGILPQIIAKGDRGQNAAQHVAREDAEEFLKKLLGQARQVDVPSVGLCDIPRAARGSGWSVISIVTALLAGQLKKVECVDPTLRFMGVLVDPVEICTVLSREVSEDLVRFHEAARLLAIKRYGIGKFLDLRDPDGQPYLNVSIVADAEGHNIALLARSEISAFLDSDIALPEIAAWIGKDSRWVKPQLAAKDIFPVNNAARIGRTFYRRRDVDNFLQS